jgi:hypothetical protein
MVIELLFDGARPAQEIDSSQCRAFFDAGSFHKLFRNCFQPCALICDGPYCLGSCDGVVQSLERTALLNGSPLLPIVVDLKHPEENVLIRKGALFIEHERGHLLQA